MSIPGTEGHIIVAVDVETTGVRFGWHEIIQIAAVPLDHDLKPTGRPFYMNIAPDFPERQDVGAKMKHGLDADELAETCLSQEDAAARLSEWFMKLDLPAGKKMIPLAHNWAFERGFLTQWLGLEAFDDMWHFHPRDTMLLGASLNDLAAWRGRDKVFPKLSLVQMSSRLGMKFENAHDALADCVACADLYRNILSTFS